MGHNVLNLEIIKREKHTTILSKSKASDKNCLPYLHYAKLLFEGFQEFPNFQPSGQSWTSWTSHTPVLVGVTHQGWCSINSACILLIFQTNLQLQKCIVKGACYQHHHTHGQGRPRSPIRQRQCNYNCLRPACSILYVL